MVTTSSGNEDDHHHDLYALDHELPISAGGELLEAGDHVYVCLPGFQHHAIVLDASTETLLIAEFTNAALAANPHFHSGSSAAASTGVQGGFRIQHAPTPHEWHKVKYQAHPLLEQTTWRAGTCSVATPDPVPVILHRVRFLRDCGRHILPDYHVLASNCESVAVWCVTGQYVSLQGAMALDVSQWTMPALASVVSPVVGVVVAGAALWHAMQVGQQRDATTRLLNREFAWYSMGKLPVGYDFQADRDLMEEDEAGEVNMCEYEDGD